MTRRPAIGFLILATLQFVAFGLMLASARRLLPIGFVWTVAAVFALAEFSLILSHLVQKPILPSMNNFLAGGVVLLMVVFAGRPERDAAYSLAERALLPTDLARTHAQVRDRFFVLIRCPGVSDVSAESVDETLLGQGYTSGDGALVTKTAKLPASPPESQNTELDLIPKEWGAYPGSPYRSFTMNARVSCPEGQAAPGVSDAWLEMPTRTAEVKPKTTGFAAESDESRKFLVAMIPAGEAENFLLATKAQSDLEGFVAVDLNLWTGLILGGWTAIALSNRRTQSKRETTLGL